MGPGLKSMRKPDKRCIALVTIIIVALLGLIDYATGDYSMLVFYFFPVAMGTWFLGIRFGLVMALFSGLVRFCADYNTYAVFTFICGLNIAKDTSFFMIISVATTLVRRMLETDVKD